MAELSNTEEVGGMWSWPSDPDVVGECLCLVSIH